MTENNITHYWDDIRNHRDVLVDIVRDEQSKVVAEIGVWKCKLTKRLLKRCGDIITQYWAVDSWKAFDILGDLDKSTRYTRMTEQAWNKAYLDACKLILSFPKLRVVRAPSVEAAKLFPKGHFDLVFIDADHSYEAVAADIKAWLPLVKKGGLLAGHDYKIRHKDIMRAVDECFGSSVTIIKDSSVWWIRRE